MKSLSVLFLCLFALSVNAQDQIVQSNIKGLISYNQQQITSLADAFSEDQYDWRPAEGVKSVREAILHVAGINYFLASKLGFPPPEDVDIMTIEKITGKDNVMEVLGKSFTFVLDKLGQISSSDFGKEVDLGFAKMSTLSSMLIVLEHCGEHKGQLIAYARSNGVTPPWSK